MNNWIETSGSPFVIVEQQYAHQWKGQENYNAICSVTDYLGKIYIDNHVLLVMGDEPMATRIVNKDGAILITRWKYAPDYLTVEKLLENDIVNGIEPIEEVEVKWDSTELVEDKEINFQRIIDSSSSERYQIKALIKGKGLIAKSISGFGQIRMPEFAEVSHLFLVREDILNINELSSIKGISLKRVSVYGDFPLDYMAIIFNEVIDCVDNIHSKREEFECMSTLVLDMSKIPSSVDGFFLKGWNKYGFYKNIVNENMKMQLLHLYKANEFLKFKEIEINGTSVTNG